MQTLKRSFFLLFFFVLAQQYAAVAQFLSRPEVVGSPGNVTVTYCAGSQFQIKFDIDQFAGTQTFIGQLSDATGNFAAATQIGSISSANGQNKFMTCTIPISQPAGSGYKVRVRAPNGTVSQNPAEATIVVVPFPAAANTDLNSYGQNNWKGFVYTYIDPGVFMTTPVALAADMYNSNKYRGYFVINNLNFDKQWTTGSTGGMPGAVPTMVDTNNVCGSYKVNYAIRLRRKHTFAPANYYFELGSDDGVRLSVDGGATWLIDAFVERQFSTTIPSPNGCAGVFLSGEKDLVIEFFQRFADSRLKINIRGTSLTAPTFPAGFDGSTICTTTASVTLGATPAGGTYTLLGGGSAGCISGDQLIPGVCGVGQKKIIYTIGAGACTKADTATVTIAQGASPLFTGFNTGLTYCSTDPAVTLTPAVTGGNFGGTGVSGNTFNPATAGVGGPYAISYTISQNGCTASSTQMVTVIAPPTIAFNIQSSVCQSVDSIPLLATPTGGNFTGTGVTGNATNGFFFKPALGTVGNNVVTYTVGAGGCVGTKPFTVVVNASPSGVAGSNSPLCLSGTLNLTTTTAATGATFLWSGPNGFTSTQQNPSIANATPTNAGTYQVRVIANGCTSAVASTVVQISNGNPAPVINANTPICLGETLTLSTTATNVTTYTWTGPNGFTSAAASPSIPSVTAANAGTYSLVVLINGCSSQPATLNIPSFLSIPATPSTASNSPLCGNDTLRLTTPTTAGATYEWTGPNGFTSALQNPKISPATSGAYSLRIKLGGNCFSLPSVVNAVINPIPAATVAANNSPLCVNGTLNLTAQTSATAGATYSWTGPNGFTSTLQNPSIPNVSMSAAGTYNVSVIAGGCTSAVASTVVQITNGLPAPSINTNSPVCVGGVLTLSSSATGVTSYAWAGPNGFTSTLANPSISSVTAANSGQYTLIININGCTSVAGIANISITPLPPIPTVTSNSPICENDTLRLNASSSVPSATFLWEGPNGFFSTLQNLKLPPTAASGDYSVRAKVGDCISLPKVQNVVVTPLPAVPAITLADTILCEGTPLALSTAAVAGATYQWKGPNSFTSALQNPTINAVTMAAAGIYTLKVTVNNCSREKTQRIVIKPRPVKAFVLSNSPLCNSEVLRMRVTNIQSNVTYNWTGPSGFTATGDSVRITTLPIIGGTYTVTPMLNGCAAVPTDVIVVLKPITTPPNVMANTPICENDKLTMTADSIAGVSYTWTGPNGFTSNKRVVVINKVTPQDSGTYSVVIQGTACPSVPTKKRIDVVPNNNNITIFQDGEVCENKEATLTAPSGYKSYLWSNGDTTRSIKVKETGTYTVSVRTNIGCPSSGKITVTRDDCKPEIYVADAFTPNGDGNNDVFQIWGNGVTKFEMRVYNRWGENIFYGESLDESWNGRFQNSECPSGDYAYIIDYELTHKGKTYTKRKRGMVNLIR